HCALGRVPARATDHGRTGISRLLPLVSGPRDARASCRRPGRCAQTIVPLRRFVRRWMAVLSDRARARERGGAAQARSVKPPPAFRRILDAQRPVLEPVPSPATVWALRAEVVEYRRPAELAPLKGDGRRGTGRSPSERLTMLAGSVRR